MNPLTRPPLATFLAALLVAIPAYAFQSPLSDESVRDAYFLGQRHDGTYPSMLSKYIKNLPAPKTGPYISSVTFKTPFLQLVEFSDHYLGNYSAQQALLDHRGQEEFVLIFVEIQLTDSYSRLMPPPPNWRSRSSNGLVPRPTDFWRDFRVKIQDGDERLTPYDFHGHANYICGPDDEGPCLLTGATLEFDLLADAFTSDTATIEVDPPEGDPVAVDFDLTALR